MDRPRSGARSPRSRRSLATAALVAIVATAAGGTPGVALTGPHRVRAGPQDQLLPAANATFLIWTENTVAFPNRYHAYGKLRGTDDVFRLNPPGTRGYAGGLDPDQDRAIYQQIEGQASDLFTINLRTGRRIKLPRPINTARWEWGPRISNRFYLFARDVDRRTTVYLYDRIARTIRTLMSRSLFQYYVSPGAAGERYATWTVCAPLNCWAYVHDADAGTTRRLPAPDRRPRYAPAVDETGGQLYFVRSGPSCGAVVRIQRVPVDDLAATPVTLVTLPDGIDVGYQLSLEPRSSRLDLWFSRFRCERAQGDVFRLGDVGG
jgi:hypothetical protein